MAITKEQAQVGVKVKIPTRKTGRGASRIIEFKKELKDIGYTQDCLLITEPLDEFNDVALGFCPPLEGQNLYASCFNIKDLDLYEEQPAEADPINPDHYNGREVFDQMLKLFGREALANFCTINAYKYRMRAGKKAGNSIEDDIKKALWYEAALADLPK